MGKFFFFFFLDRRAFSVQIEGIVLLYVAHSIVR